MKGDNVIVFELFEERGFSNGGEGCPLLFLKSYLFQRHNLLCQTENEILFKLIFEKGCKCTFCNI